MPPAAPFAIRWARENLNREATPEEIIVLNLFPVTCQGNEAEAAKRARRYYAARGPGGLSELWHKRHPDDDDILSNCQDVYIVPLRCRTAGGRRVTIVRLPAPSTHNKPVSTKALFTRWLMIMDIRLREDPSPGEEVIFLDVTDLQPSNIKHHFKGTYWKDFIYCMKSVYPIRISEVHVINTHRLKIMSLLLLHVGLYHWKRNEVKVHGNAVNIEDALVTDWIHIEDLPIEYGGRTGFMKDLNDEWTKKLLSNSKWLQTDERLFYKTDLKPEARSRMRHRNAVLGLCGNIASYNVVTSTHSCRPLHRHDDMDEEIHGAYRTFKVSRDCNNM